MATATPASSTLWATTSKTWEIPPRPRPGRKPKADTQAKVAALEEPETADGGRRVQNRAAQRAFRERKQTQLSELQARLQAYEHGEIERNVALQNIAKRLKEENEVLRKENASLKERIASLENGGEVATGNVKKRWRDSSPQASQKRSRTANRQSSFDDPSTSSAASSPSASEESFEAPPSPHPQRHTTSISVNMHNDIGIPHPHPPPTFDQSDFFFCGFCTQDTSCVCREVMLQQQQSMMGLKPQIYEPNPIISMIDMPVSSILDNLPAYQPAVPLRRKSTRAKVESVFPVVPAAQLDECSGDPSNCRVCADDTFGKAFCEAINKSVATLPSCSDCPSNCAPGPNVEPLDSLPTSSDTMPTNDAWQQLKSHPNVSFADLSLLADVVARRSKCTGPRVVLSPPPPAELGEAPVNMRQVVLNENHMVPTFSRSSPPRLVPQEILIQCGQRRVKEVQADGVREALRLLDAKFVR